MTANRLLLVHFTPPDIIGGVEHIMHQHIELFRQRGYLVDVVAGRSSSAGPVHVIPQLDAASPEGERLDRELSAGAVTPRFHASRLAILERLAKLASNAETLIVHNAFTLHFSLPLTAALWEMAAHRAPGRTIAWSHDLSWVNPLYLPQMHDGYPWNLLRTPAPNVRYVTVSAVRAQELQGIWPDWYEPVEVIPNGIDIQKSMQLSPETMEIVMRFRLLDRDMVLLLPVRITRRKNVQAAIETVRCLKDRRFDALLLVTAPLAPHHPASARAYLDRLKALRTQLDVEKEVIFLADDLGANASDTTVSELYRLADALLFPSFSEGFGLPILEAGLARLPAVVSDLPVFQEVGGTDVWTFEPQDAADRIAGQIIQVLRQPPSRLYRRVLREYRWDTIMDTKIVPLLRGAEG